MKLGKDESKQNDKHVSTDSSFGIGYWIESWCTVWNSHG